jgi:hypothetical protein
VYDFQFLTIHIGRVVTPRVSVFPESEPLQQPLATSDSSAISVGDFWPAQARRLDILYDTRESSDS